MTQAATSHQLELPWRFKSVYQVLLIAELNSIQDTQSSHWFDYTMQTPQLQNIGTRLSIFTQFRWRFHEESVHPSEHVSENPFLGLVSDKLP